MRTKKTIFQLISAAALTGALVISSFAMAGDIKHPLKKFRKKKSAENMVVLELFTSQGCSSCPPADALMAEYVAAHDARIIPISFHVDYWNRLGWADPFSSRAYSSRQQWYSQHFPKGSVYTPQLIANGRDETVGNNRSSVKNLVQKELAVKQNEILSIEELTIGKADIQFRYTVTNPQPQEVLNIALVQKQATTNIKGGENEGVVITNHNIVRSFTTIQASADGRGTINLPRTFKTTDYSLVLYTQNKTDYAINASMIKELQ